MPLRGIDTDRDRLARGKSAHLRTGSERNDDCSTTAALAAVRRLSFTTLDAPDARAVYRTLAAELLGVFGVDQVHVCRVAQDETLSRGTGYVLLGEHVRACDDYVVPFDKPSGVHHVLRRRAAQHPQATSSPLVASALVERFSAASPLYLPPAYAGSVRSVSCC